MCSEERHAIELIRIQAEAHPNPMQMIGHEAIRGAENSLAGGGVQHQFAKCCVKSLTEPTFAAVRGRKGPMHHGVALVVLARQARKIERAIQVRFVHSDGEIIYVPDAKESSAIDSVAADVRRLK